MSKDSVLALDERVLVTGANGFIGAKVVEILLERGFRSLRCFVRPSSRLDRLQAAIDRQASAADVEMVSGDLLSREDCRRAAEDVSVVYHLAAGFDKSFAGAFMNSALATRNLIEAALEKAPLKRFVNVSSFAVYSNLGLKRGRVAGRELPAGRFAPGAFRRLRIRKAQARAASKRIRRSIRSSAMSFLGRERYSVRAREI